MTDLHWTCMTPDCTAAGTTTGTESGADQRHVEAEQHATNAHLREWAGDGREAE